MQSACGRLRTPSSQPPKRSALTLSSVTQPTSFLSCALWVLARQACDRPMLPGTPCAPVAEVWWLYWALAGGSGES